MMTTWFPTLITPTPEEGFDLAIKLARMAVKKTQPDETVRDILRPQYASDATELIAASHVVAVHFATIAAANGYWTANGDGRPR
ncbi:MAG: hexameric tyrosine-coordinated heme protein [Rhodobiaceae bacterium]|nr:hexameric tyrosine-coordinated heme protein [Rhodobiaceae bacterium]